MNREELMEEAKALSELIYGYFGIADERDDLYESVDEFLWRQGLEGLVEFIDHDSEYYDPIDLDDELNARIEKFMTAYLAKCSRKKMYSRFSRNF